jgi:hypothetical protein
VTRPLALLALLILLLVAACSGSDSSAGRDRTGHYEETCTGCGARWTIDVLSTAEDRLEVTIKIENTGELGPLDIRGEQVLAVTFSQTAKEAWLKDYAQARADGRLETTEMPRVFLVPTKETKLPTRLEPRQEWQGTFEANGVPEDVQAVMISFQSYVAVDRPGSPSTFSSRDARRPFINLGNEITVAAVPTSTPAAGPRRLSFQGAIRPADNDAAAPVRYRFLIEPWLTSVEGVTIQPPLPGGNASGVLPSYNLNRVGPQSILEIGIPRTVPRQDYQLTIQLAGGGTVTIPFTHTP